MDVTFYYDPSCPFCWITSRWLLQVSGQRDLTITWQPFSLAIKNNELAGGGNEKTEHGELHRAAHRILRVIVAASEQTTTPQIDLYTAFGIKYHVAGFDYDDDMIRDVLAELELSDSLLEAADNTAIDEQIETSMKMATDVAGDDIGVPTIVFTNTDGSQQGFFGPVLQTLPTIDEALDLWDGLSKLATNTSFYELKRSRPDGGPDVASTAKC